MFGCAAPAPVLGVLLLAVALKALWLADSYRSTDFEVHRNWLAVTWTGPVQRWYFNDVSQWTLDYPPLFAFFERGLAEVAVLLWGEAHEDPDESTFTVQFQRGSVIVTDLLFWVGIVLLLRRTTWTTTQASGPQERRYWCVVFALAVLSAPVLLVDHVHFQYNGFLLGVLLLAVALPLHDDEAAAWRWKAWRAHQRRPGSANVADWRFVGCALLFSALLMLKHLFLTLAPVFFVFLLRAYCIVPQDLDVRAAVSHKETNNSKFWGRALRRVATLGAAVLLVCGLSLGPFLVQQNPAEQLAQMLSRLFPFDRGLVHAYWAPNIWALYCGADWVLSILLRAMGLLELRASSTRGLVEHVDFQVLPAVSPLACLLLTLAAIAPALVALWRRPTGSVLLRATAYASMCSFMLGWHVHEKALMIPHTLATFFMLQASTAARDGGFERRMFLRFTFLATFQLFPLFITLQEIGTKVCALLAYTTFAFAAVTQLNYDDHPRDKKPVPTLQWWDTRIFLPVFAALATFSEIMTHWLVPAACAAREADSESFPRLLEILARFQFLPLLCISVFTALCLLPIWYTLLRSVQHQARFLIKQR